MVGNYSNKKAKYLEYLANWKDTVIRDKLWEKFDDLHINEISKEFKNPELWIEGGLFLYDCLITLIDRTAYDCIFCIPLSDTHSQVYWHNINVAYLKKNLDLTPPSFYLFPIGSYNYEQTIRESALLESLSVELNKKAHFKVEEIDNTYARTVYVKDS